jgi:hypothetical protein
MAVGFKTGGRQAGTPNRATAELKELARAYTVEALEALVSVVRGADGAAKVAAAREILDRGYGKASQSVDLGATDGMAEAIKGALAWKPPQ